MRLIFLYVAHRKAKHFSEVVKTEGYYWLLKRMVETGVVDSVDIVITSGGDEFSVSYEGGLMNCHVLNGLHRLDDKFNIRVGDVVWCRGGWKAWAPHLQALARRGVWTMLYAANTGRQKWKWWHVILDDLRDGCVLDALGRFHMYWRKPMNPGIFFPTNVDRDYDVCIGASHVHDRKAQWKMVEVSLAYRRLFGADLRCVMPGLIQRGTQTNHIRSKVADNKMKIDLLGGVPRSKVAAVMNRSKLFVYMGGHGQNDRGPLEAMSCGTMPLVAAPHRHDPVFGRMGWVIEQPNNFEATARQLRSVLGTINEETRKTTREVFQESFDVDRKILPEMAWLLGVMKMHPRADASALKEAYGV